MKFDNSLSVEPLVRALSSSAEASDVQEMILDDTGAEIGNTLDRHEENTYRCTETYPAMR